MLHLHASFISESSPQLWCALRRMRQDRACLGKASCSCSSSQHMRGYKHCSSSMRGACRPENLLDAVPAPVEPCIPLQHAQHYCIVVRQDDWTVLQALDPSVSLTRTRLHHNLCVVQHTQPHQPGRDQAWPGLSNSGPQEA